MRVTAKQYAKTLYDLTKDKSSSEVDGLILQFSQMLKKNGQLRLKNDIIKKYTGIYNRENGIMEAEVTSRETLSEELRSKLRNMLRSRYGAKEVLINNKIDEAIKGGVIIRVGDEVLDASVSKQLEDLRKILSR